MTHRNVKLKIWLAALAFCLCFFHHPFPGSGVYARLDMSLALVNQGTVSIDAYHGNTHDKTEVDGHYYSDKAPLLSLFGAASYKLVRLAEDIFGIALTFRLAGYLITLLTLTLPTILLLVLLRRHLEAYVPGGPALFVVTLYALGTMTIVYSMIFFGHQLAAIFCLSSYLAAYKRVRCEDKKIGYSALAGALAGLAILVEHPTGLIAVFIMVYLAVGLRRISEIAAYAICAFIVPAFLLALYNQQVYGDWLHLGYAQPYLDYYASTMQQGFFGIALPKLSSLLLILLSPSRGLFIFSPFLLLAIPGLVVMVRDDRQRREGWLIVAIVLSYLLFNASYAHPAGGTCFGPRHLAPMIVFLMIPIQVWLARSDSDWRQVAVGLGLLSILFTGLSVAVEPMFPEHIANPLVELILPLAFAYEYIDNLALFAGLSFGWSLLSYIVAVILALCLGLDAWSTDPEDRVMELSAQKMVPAAFFLIVCLFIGASLWGTHTGPGIVHQAMGNRYSEQARWRQAVSEYEKASVLRTDSYIHFYQARAYLMLGEKENAKEALREALRIDPGFPHLELIRRSLQELEP